MSSINSNSSDKKTDQHIIGSEEEIDQHSLTIIQFFTVLGIGFMLLGGLGMLLMEAKNRRVIGIFMFGSVIVLASAFYENPNMIAEAQVSIAKLLIGLIGTIISVIKLKISRKNK